VINSSTFLRRALLADAVFSGISAVLLVITAAPLSTMLALPETFLKDTGLFLVPYALLVGYLGWRTHLRLFTPWLVIGGNGLWTLASFALLFGHWLSPNLLGEAMIAGQALAVGVIAELQYIGLRKSGMTVAAV
jgi:hypothetical protein